MLTIISQWGNENEKHNEMSTCEYSQQNPTDPQLGIDEQIVVYPCMEFYKAIKRKELLIGAIMWMSFKRYAK